MIVVDNSAIVDLLLQQPINEELRNRLEAAGELHAPHLLDIEFLSVLRRMVSRSLIDSTSAGEAKAIFEALPIERYPHTPLLDRIWALRHNLTAYDATYVALSETLGLPLVTSDRKLADAPGNLAKIEAYAR